jgi:hypothetical protein
VFVERYPKLLDHINRRIGDFIADPEQRSKRVRETLYPLLPLLSSSIALKLIARLLALRSCPRWATSSRCWL